MIWKIIQYKVNKNRKKIVLLGKIYFKAKLRETTAIAHEVIFLKMGDIIYFFKRNLCKKNY